MLSNNKDLHLIGYGPLSLIWQRYFNELNRKLFKTNILANEEEQKICKTMNGQYRKANSIAKAMLSNAVTEEG